MDHQPPDFRVKPIKIMRTILSRLVWEDNNKGILMNSKVEWGRNNIIRFDPQVTTR